MTQLKTWIQSSRPQTLIAGISPVLIGTSIASSHQPLSYWVFSCCLLFSLFLQIGTNWANDYFDFIKGADTRERIGPRRAVQSGLIAPKTMRNASWVAFSLAALVSLPLLFRIGWIYFPGMPFCILCGLLYTGGKYPLGYLGLGDLLVFIFYGPIATGFTALAQLHHISHEVWVASLIPGALSCAILSVNNLRDIEQDQKARKMTLVARFGARFGQYEYALCLLLPLLALPLTLFWIWIPLIIAPMWLVFRREKLNRALALTAGLLASITLILVLYEHL